MKSKSLWFAISDDTIKVKCLPRIHSPNVIVVLLISTQYILMHLKLQRNRKMKKKSNLFERELSMLLSQQSGNDQARGNKMSRRWARMAPNWSARAGTCVIRLILSDWLGEQSRKRCLSFRVRWPVLGRHSRFGGLRCFDLPCGRIRSLWNEHRV